MIKNWFLIESDRLVGRIRAGDLREGGGNCLKYLKGAGTETRGEDTKILKRGQAGSRGGCLKKVGWNPLSTMGADWTNEAGYRHPNVTNKTALGCTELTKAHIN